MGFKGGAPGGAREACPWGLGDQEGGVLRDSRAEEGGAREGRLRVIPPRCQFVEPRVIGQNQLENNGSQTRRKDEIL